VAVAVASAELVMELVAGAQRPPQGKGAEVAGRLLAARVEEAVAEVATEGSAG